MCGQQYSVGLVLGRRLPSGRWPVWAIKGQSEWLLAIIPPGTQGWLGDWLPGHSDRGVRAPRAGASACRLCPLVSWSQPEACWLRIWSRSPLDCLHSSGILGGIPEKGMSQDWGFPAVGEVTHGALWAGRSPLSPGSLMRSDRDLQCLGKGRPSLGVPRLL